MVNFLKKAALAAAVVMSFGGAANAATLNTGVNDIALNQVYFYQETMPAGGADSRTFTLNSLIPLNLTGSVVTLTLKTVNAIINPSVTLKDLLGTVALVPVYSSQTSVIYEFDTAFNVINGLSKDLIIGWDAITSTIPDEGGAQFQVQIATSAVPVPAGGLLLLGALGGLAALRRRKAV